ncbi:MAG: cyclophilin-like family protein [Thermoplasmata archaeon]
MTRFRLVAGDMALEGSFTDENPRTVQVILNSLPIEGSAMRWGEEVYFSTDIEIPEENGRQDMEIGEVAFWPAGKAIAVFFGRTPASVSDQPRAFENVNVFGKLEGDASVLDEVKNGDRILVQAM